MVNHGIIIFDDYDFSTTTGITQYCNDLIDTRKFIFIHNLNGHAIFIKNTLST